MAWLLLVEVQAASFGRLFGCLFGRLSGRLLGRRRLVCLLWQSLPVLRRGFAFCAPFFSLVRFLLLRRGRVCRLWRVGRGRFGLGRRFLSFDGQWA